MIKILQVISLVIIALLMMSASCDKGSEGCTDSNACNYNQLATENNGSCIYFEVINLYPLDNQQFIVNNENVDSNLVFAWNYPDECDYESEGDLFRLQIFNEDSDLRSFRDESFPTSKF